MLKILASLALFVPLCTLASQPTQSDITSIDKWIPSGWKTIRITHGDLAHEGKKDIAIIVEKYDPENQKKNGNGLGPKDLNLNPRRLIVFFEGHNGYKKVLDTDKFIPTENSEKRPCLLDPLADGDISVLPKSLLTIELHYSSTCGGWSTSVKTWKFRYENNHFRLIGVDEFSHIRNTGDESKVSTNFLTVKIKEISQSHLDNYKKEDITWKDITSKKVFYLDEISPTYCKLNKDITNLCP